MAADEPELVIIAAVAANDVIGRDGTLPWSYPADLARFKELTMGHPVIMGRRTYESIVDRLDQPLPGRVSVVLSRRSLPLPRNAVHVDSIDEAIEAASLAGNRPEIDGSTTFIAGGASVYDQFIDRADRLELTELAEAYEGDSRFPNVDDQVWQEVAREQREALDFVTYTRRD